MSALQPAPASWVPIIPDDAPFSHEQRAWLNGFLAGLFSQAPAPAAPTKPALQIAVCFASQSGTAERLARKLGKELKAAGHTPAVQAIDTLTPEQLAAVSHCAIIVSTYGEGEAPDHARGFQQMLQAATAPSLAGLNFAVLALGDRNYEQFCQFGIELDERLAKLGASRLIARVDCDVDVDEPFAAWKSALLNRLEQSEATSATISAAAVEPVPTPAAAAYTRERPFHAVLKQRYSLTSATSSKQTVHVSLGLDETIEYAAGDACGIVVENCSEATAELLGHLPFSPADELEIAGVGKVSLLEALTRHLQHTRLTRKAVEHFARATNAAKLTQMLEPGKLQVLEAYLHGRDLVDLVEEFPGIIANPQELTSILPKLMPRLYSISSSPAAHRNEVHCTIGVVRYTSHGRNRGGVGSTMLGERVATNNEVPIYIQPNKRFRLPADGATPIVMIGPGTGIAPFRSFLHERRALGHMGRNWLFFGERSAETDFYYQQELHSMLEDRHLTRLDTAFSRDQAHKIYVQDRIMEHGAELWTWLDAGASVYICGDASRMAKDVDQALHTVVERHGNMNPDSAREYIAAMNDSHRYHRDVY